MGKDRVLWGVLLIAGILSAPAFSQTVQGDIIGTVRDSQGAAVPGAHIRIVNESTGAVRELVTDDRGEYNAVGFFPGTYRLEVEKLGFQKAVVTGLKVEAVTVKRADVTLDVSAVQEQVTVMAEAPVLQTEGPTVNSNLPSVLYDKPINDTSRSGWALSPAMWAPGSGSGPNAIFVWYGAKGSQTELEAEGSQQPISYFANPSAVQEVSIVAGAPPAEYARAVTTNITFKSGTNQPHGMYVLSLRNYGLDAVGNPFTRNPQRAPGFPLWRHEFNFGGPVYIPKVYDGRNKTFFFIDYWRPRGSFVIKQQPVSIPTANMRNGNYTVFPVKPKDPATGQTFPGDIIPPERLSPVAKAIMADLYSRFAYVGDPNSFTNNATSDGWFGGAQNDTTLKLDQNFGSKDVLNFTFYRGVSDSLQNLTVSTPVSGTKSNFDTAFDQVLNNKRYSLGYTHTFTPHIVNQLRLAGTRYIQLTDVINNRQDRSLVLGKDILARWGIQGITPTGLSGYPGLVIQNWNGIASGNASGSWDTRYQFAEDLTYIYGAHSLKGGVSGIKSLLDTPFVPGFGNFNFDGRFTGEPFADFLLGLPGTFTRTLPRAAIARRIWEYGVFAQDDWRISSRLMLSYGLRWDYFTAPYDKNHQYFNFDFPTGKIVVPDQQALNTVNPAFRTDLVPVVLASSIGYPNKLTNPTGRFLPRFGVAYRPLGRASTVIRGGYGVYQGAERFAAVQTGGPFAVTESFTNAVANGTPQYAWPNPFPGLGTASGASTGSSVSTDFRPEYTQAWNVSVEQQFLRDWGLRLSYIGNKSTQMAYQYDANSARLSTAPFSQSRRPFPAFQSINRVDVGANDHYNALQILVHHPFRSGVYLEVSYTEQRSRNDIGGGGPNGFLRESAPGGTLDYAYDRGREQARSNQWPWHDFVMNWDWELPFGKGKRFLANPQGPGQWLLARVVGGWSTSGIFTWHSGHFFTPRYTGYDAGNINQFSGRPDVVPGCAVYTGNPLGDRSPYINLSCFKVPANGTLGNAQINSLVAPNNWVVTLSPWKEVRFPKWERGRLRVGANIYNLFNHPAYGAQYSSVGVITSPNGAFLDGVEVRRDTETYGQRAFFFSARLMF